MENLKLPFLPVETLRTQRVEIYLQDLKDRLNELRMRHDEVIKNSVEIIKEIDEVSSTLLLNQAVTAGTREERMTKIKKLIHEFETDKVQCNSKAPVVAENGVDIRKMLQNFERLNNSDLLRDSLILFHKAKESFEKINTLLADVEDNNKDIKKINISESIRHKIHMLNQNEIQKEELETVCNYIEGTPPNFKEVAVVPNQTNSQFNNETLSVDLRDTVSNYASCCSSSASLTRKKENNEKFSNNVSFSGYEGDNDDSEFDMLLPREGTN